MNKLIRISVSPFSPPLETVGDKIVEIHVPYSEKEVTVLINPSLNEYKENDDQPGFKVRQVMVTENTNETQELTFDFGENVQHDLEINGMPHTLKLMSIGTENLQGQDFPVFEFFIDAK